MWRIIEGSLPADEDGNRQRAQSLPVTARTGIDEDVSRAYLEQTYPVIRSGSSTGQTSKKLRLLASMILLARVVAQAILRHSH